ncbi:hypothetical protein [Streptomyces sp. Ncost-T10-10d]|uniref:hypothetical protein n=1 Tax=Streptomyces sp. Ncost-T10-10d TaxID=1839774 RepID=UPI00081DD0BC|nr:hypothetical protein GA0115254_1115102 [Streptomyces sp. Ncost-T10-10d]
MRAPESSAGADGVVRAASGWADPVVTPQRGVRAVDGPLTGLQGPEASYPLMPTAVAGRDAPAYGYARRRAIGTSGMGPGTSICCHQSRSLTLRIAEATVGQFVTRPM